MFEIIEGKLGYGKTSFAGGDLRLYRECIRVCHSGSALQARLALRWQVAVNGFWAPLRVEQIPPYPLNPGDVIEIGDTHLRFVL